MNNVEFSLELKRGYIAPSPLIRGGRAKAIICINAGRRHQAANSAAAKTSMAKQRASREMKANNNNNKKTVKTKPDTGHDRLDKAGKVKPPDKPSLTWQAAGEAAVRTGKLPTLHRLKFNTNKEPSN